MNSMKNKREYKKQCLILNQINLAMKLNGTQDLEQNKIVKIGNMCIMHAETLIHLFQSVKSM